MSSLHSVWNFLCRFKYWVIFGFAVLIIGFVDENSILNRSQRWQTIAELRREISDYESRFEAASRMIESLDKEPGKLEQLAIEREAQNGRRSTGRPEQYYGEMIRQPAFRIELPVNSGNKEEEEREIRDLMLLPLEYIYSLVQL